MSGHSDEHVGNDKHVYQGGNQAASAAERRRAALEEIDEAKFSWFHVKACIVAGVGFFTDAYDIL
jgi:PHS family inorganic phosphate transporter-like MFS transporter